MNKDIIILKLLFGWEIIHLSKRGKKVTIRFREFPDAHSRFLRAIFSNCSPAVMLDYKKGQIEDFSLFNFKCCILYVINIENDGIVSIRLLKENNPAGALNIRAGEVSFDLLSFPLDLRRQP